METKHTNKFFALLLAILMVVAILPLSAITTFAAEGDVPVTGVNFTMSYAEIPTGKAMGFAAEVLPENATNKNVTYTSSDYSVAVVDPSTGKITGMKAGTATITATSQDGNFTDTVEVKVIDGLGETNTVIFYGESTTSPYETQTVGVGNKLRQPAVAPTKEGHIFCGWYTSWECVAPWDFDDTVGTGLIMIYAKFVAEADYVAASGISLSTNSFTYDLKGNAIYPLTAKVAPENASETPIIIWSVSDPSVVEITENSSNQIYFKGLKPSTATITATTKDGAYSASCVVTVTDSRSISLQSTASFDLAYVTGVTLSATVEPSDTTNKELIWTVDDPSILEIEAVDNDTVILNGLKEGVATVTVSTEDGAKSASCVVTVNDTSFVFEIDGYLPGGNVSDISISSENASSITQYKLYKDSTEVTGKIIDKTVYTLKIYFSCDSNILDGLTKEDIFLGELTATHLVRSGPNNAIVTFELPALEYIEIDNLDIYITPPIAGQAPATTLTGSDPRVNVTVNWSPSPSVFVEGTTYLLSLTLDVKPGYKFPEAILMDAEEFQSQGKYKINGANVLSISYTLPSATGTTILSKISLWHSFTALPPHTHTYTNSVLQKNDTHHWLECDATDCPDKLGSKKDITPHSGGTATCLAQAVCSCGQSYGALGAHTFGEWQNEVAATCVATGTKAHKDCSVCHKHFAADGVTEITDLTLAIDTTNHDMATEWTKTAEGHYHVCKRTGCEYHDTLTTHTPDKAAATETESVNCTVCGYVITPALGHTTHTPKTEWKSDADNHWHECTGCEGQQLDKAAHADTNNDEKCDTCGYDMPASGTEPGTEPGTTPGTEPGTTPGTDDPNTPDDDKDGLGAGAIVGIVVGVLAVLGGGGFALYWFVLRKKPILPTDPTTPIEEAPDTDVDADTDEDAEATDEDDSPETDDEAPDTEDAPDADDEAPDTEDTPETEDKKDTE